MNHDSLLAPSVCHQYGVILNPRPSGDKAIADGPVERLLLRDEASFELPVHGEEDVVSKLAASVFHLRDLIPFGVAADGDIIHVLGVAKQHAFTCTLIVGRLSLLVGDRHPGMGTFHVAAQGNVGTEDLLAVGAGVLGVAIFISGLS